MFQKLRPFRLAQTPFFTTQRYYQGNHSLYHRLTSQIKEPVLLLDIDTDVKLEKGNQYQIHQEFLQLNKQNFKDNVKLWMRFSTIIILPGLYYDMINPLVYPILLSIPILQYGLYFQCLNIGYNKSDIQSISYDPEINKLIVKYKRNGISNMFHKKDQYLLEPFKDTIKLDDQFLLTCRNNEFELNEVHNVRPNYKWHDKQLFDQIVSSAFTDNDEPEKENISHQQQKITQKNNISEDVNKAVNKAWSKFDADDKKHNKINKNKLLKFAITVFNDIGGDTNQLKHDFDQVYNQKTWFFTSNVSDSRQRQVKKFIIALMMKQ